MNDPEIRVCDALPDEFEEGTRFFIFRIMTPTSKSFGAFAGSRPEDIGELPELHRFPQGTPCQMLEVDEAHYREFCSMVTEEKETMMDQQIIEQVRDMQDRSPAA